MTAPTPSVDKRRRFSPRLQISLATQLLVLIVLVTLISALAVHTYVRQQQLAETRNHLDLHAKVLSDRLSDYENLLLSGYSFLYADKVPGTSLGTFVNGLHLEQYFPSVHQMSILRFTGQRLSAAPLQLGTVEVSPGAGELIRQEVNAAMADGTIHITAPFTARSRVPGGEEYRSLMIIQPCAPARMAGSTSCALYLLVDVEQLLQEVGQLTPMPNERIRILMNGQPLNSSMTGGAVTGSAAPNSAVPDNSVPDKFVSDKAAGQGLTTQVNRLGHEWTLQARVPQLTLSNPSSLLAPLVLMMGLLAGLLTHRLVSDQLRLNRRLHQANLDLGASQSYLEQSRADFSAIFQAMDGGAAFTTPDGFVRMMNRRYLDLLGLSFREVAGQHMDQVRDRTVVDEPGNRRALFSDEAPEEYSEVVRRMHGPGGQTFWGEMSRSRVVGQGQELLGYLHVLRDVSEALETQRRLRDQEQQSRAALDGVPHVLWLSNRLGRLTYANQQFRDLLSGPAVREQVHPDDQATYDRLWEETYSLGQQREADVRLALRTPEALFLHQQEPQAPAPGWRWVSLKVAPLATISGEVNEWIAVATDVHARLLAEQRAVAEQDHYRLVLSGMPQLVWTADAQWNITYVNGRWYELQPGLPAPADLAELAQPVHPDDLDKFRRAVTEARELSRPLEVEVQMVGPEGLYRTYVVRAVPLLGDGSDVVEWVGTTTNVDDQVQAEFSARLMVQISDALSPPPSQGNELLIQRRSYQMAVELLAESLGAAAALWRLDPLPPASPDDSAGPAGAGSAAPRWQVHWLGQSYQDEYPLTPELMQTIEGLVCQAAQRRESFIDRASPLLHQIGVTEFLSLPLLGHDGSLRGMLGLAFLHPVQSRDYTLAGQLAQRFALALDNDILRQRAIQAQQDLQNLNRSLEQRVQERTHELDEANRELEAFSYSVSHDLRTPLRHMTGFGELLRKKLQAENEDLSRQTDRYLNVILESGQRMGQLIDDLLEFSRTGRAELRQQQVDLGALIGRVWEALQPDREGRQVALQVGPLPTVYGDERLLAQVFSNLLSNALKYSRTKGEVLIQVDSTEEGKMAEIRVRDNGVGFDPRYTDKLFGVFQRLHSNDEFEGTGIGLANVRRIIMRHGGQVAAQGEPGVGATFTVTLPLEPRPEQPALPSDDSAKGPQA
ncbi:ATP-binding protein [Deinococcus sp. Marseille-Q6407]|uniref:ATP-binding protein n=1 Tax=Deinococcus sp. Marseille-Q6407 TaxID=2969223 RepID=UPI0021BFF129|nr:ATP-binding protein [Deinococcus sp. Marseille-Q6407]